jgi:hypothetical protein
MWILSLLPDALLYFAIVAILFSGIAMFAFSFFLNLFPAAKPYRLAIQATGSILAIMGVYLFGSYSTEMKWRERVRELEAKVAIADQQSKDSNEKLKTVYVDRVKVVKDTKIVIQEKIINEAAKMDVKCEVIPEAITIVNDAAKSPKAKK